MRRHGGRLRPKRVSETKAEEQGGRETQKTVRGMSPDTRGSHGCPESEKKVSAAQSCLTLCHPTKCIAHQAPLSLSAGKNTGVLGVLTESNKIL